MTLHEHARVYLDIQLATQISHALRLMLSAAIGKENERYPLRLKVRQGLGGSRQRIGASNEYSIDTDGRQSSRERDAAGMQLNSKANANSGTLVDAATVCNVRRGIARWL